MQIWLTIFNVLLKCRSCQIGSWKYSCIGYQDTWNRCASKSFPKKLFQALFFRAVPHGIVISLFQRELICHLSSHKSTDITCFKYQLGLKFYFGKTRN